MVSALWTRGRTNVLASDARPAKSVWLLASFPLSLLLPLLLPLLFLLVFLLLLACMPGHQEMNHGPWVRSVLATRTIVFHTWDLDGEMMVMELFVILTGISPNKSHLDRGEHHICLFLILLMYLLYLSLSPTTSFTLDVDLQRSRLFSTSSLPPIEPLSFLFPSFSLR